MAVACAGHKLGDPCITRANMEQCLQLMHRGCSSAALIVMESCPLQFACSTLLAENSAREDCGPAGTCGYHAHCRGACPPPGPCASVVCACDGGFEGDGYACEATQSQVMASNVISSHESQLPQLPVNLYELLVALTAIATFIRWMIYQRARCVDARKDECMPTAQTIPLAAAPYEAGPAGAQVIWSTIGRVACEGGGLLHEEASIPSYCDGELTGNLPPEVIRAFLAQLVSTAAALGEWRRTSPRVESLANGCGAGAANVVAWEAAGLQPDACAEGQSAGPHVGPRGRIEVWRGTGAQVDDDGLAALELEGRVALIVGCALGHPYVSCNLCYFGNSEGSSTWVGHDIDESTPPGDVATLITKIAETYMLEQIH